MLLLFTLLMSFASHTLAGEFCSTFPEDSGNPGTHIIDGSDPLTVQRFNDDNITQITVDTNCTFRNWDPLTVTINFQTPGAGLKPIYLITFDNVNYTGNMACANIDHKFWVVNSPVENFSFKCQDLFIPVEKIDKHVPPGKTTVGIGEVFTYTLTIPVLYDPVDGTFIPNAGSPNELHGVKIYEDLNAINANLTLVGIPVVTWVSSGLPVNPTFTSTSNDLRFINPGAEGSLQFDIPGTIPIGEQIQIDITVSVDDNNIIGTQFFNTASWKFGRVISLDPDGDGFFDDFFFDPLPGENGVSEVLTIGAPDLTVTKTSPDAALNIGVPGSFTINVQNTGNTDAWSPTIVDVLPDITVPDPPNTPLLAGMCDAVPSNINVGLFEAGGALAPNQPVLGDDYTISFVSPSTELPSTPPTEAGCDLKIVVDSTATNNIIIEPNQRLIITYNAQLDVGVTADGVDLTNVAAATQWFSANPGGTPAFTTFSPGINNSDPGTPAVIDNQDTHTVDTGLSGYFFTKSVENITTGEFPATTAAAGDTLRYTLRIFNVDQTISNITVIDDLSSTDFDKTFGTSGYSEVSQTGVASVSYSGNVLTLTGNDLVALGDEFVYVFDVRMDAGLSNGDTVSNQASLDATGVTDGEPLVANVVAFSDDPFVNGISDPLDSGDIPESTDVNIVQPGPLLKTGGPATATIGDEFTYQITVPQVVVNIPLYDVQILDDLTANGADLELVSASVFSGGSWTLTTGTSTDIIIEDTGSGIDIPAGEQAVIDITVRLSNTINNDIGNTFTNSATYTYNRVNGVSDPLPTGNGNSTVTTTTITESSIINPGKTVDNATPTAGEIVRYTISLTAESGANLNDVFDVIMVDTLDLGLVYDDTSPGALPPSVTIGNNASGSGVADDNSILPPVITGDGINIAQQLVWSRAEADIDIDAGETVQISYSVRVLDSVLAGQTMNNSAVVQWTGIDDTNINERTGIDGFGVEPNDYATDVMTAPVTTPNIVATIDKQRTGDTYGSGDDDVRIGDIVEYTLTIPVPEGTLGNLTLVDALPTGLVFIDVVSINGDTGPDPFTAVAPFTHADIPLASIVEAGNTVTWNLGDISNPFNDGAADDFVIVYRARVLNGDVLVQQDNTSLNNEVRLSFDDASGTNTNAAEDLVTAINVVQPNLAVNKSAAAQFVDNLLVAGENITYTVEIINTGTAPAYDAVLQDAIPAELLAAATPVTTTVIELDDNGGNITPLTLFNPTDIGGGVYQWNFDSNTYDEYTIPAGYTLRIVYVVTADTPLAEGLTLTNTAEVVNYYSLDDEVNPTPPPVSPSNPDTSREVYPDPLATVSDSNTLYTGAPPSKVLLSPAVPEATIGEEVVYTITVPDTPPTSTLFDVNITDVLDPKLVHLVADTTINITGTGNVITNNNTAAGLDIVVDQIDAGTQVTIELHARVTNADLADDPDAGEVIVNTAAYSYAFTDGGAPQPALSTGNVDVTVVEPLVTMTKTVTDTALNAVINAVAGDVLRYTLELTAAGNPENSDAFDVSIVDDLSLGLAYQAGTATINTAPLADPLNVTGGDGVTTAQQLEWSLANSGADIDITEGTVVTITYDVLVLNEVAAGQTLTNSAVAQWSSLDGADINGIERDGSDGFGGDPNDYETQVQATSVTVPDTNSITKSKLSDTFNAADADVRNGDTVTYQLDIILQEGSTRDVVITDDLDVLNTGLEFVGIVSIDGDPLADYDPLSSNFSYGTITAGDINYDSGTAVLTISIGDVVNTPDGDATNDTLTIIYEATVNVPVQTPNTQLDNTATLGYDDFTGTPVVFDPSRHESTASISGLQPVMTIPTKVDTGFTSPANVSIATDIMQFTLESCNDINAAPAYNVQISDDLPSQLNETSIAGPVNGALQPDVYINGVLATEGAGNDYVYNGPIPRDGVMVFTLNDSTQVNPGECVTIQYNIGFHTDFGTNQNWNNSVIVDEYWSLPGSSGTQYDPEGPTTFFMTNNIIAVDSPLKVLTSPAASEATIGEEVVYTITVPENPVNTAAIYEVHITDTLDPKLVHLLADTAINIAGTGSVITNNNTAAGLDIVVDRIDAGTQVVIELHARVTNANLADDPEFGEVIANTASFEYSFTDSGPLEPLLTSASSDVTVIEPQLTMTMAATDTALNPVANAVAGDVLRYTLTLTTSGGANFSDAFDASIVDDLGLGLAYQAGSATINTAPLADPLNVTAGDGVNTAQQLEWSLDNSGADIDITEGTVVVITYDVLVLNQVVAGQTLTNSGVARWTSLNGADINGIERDGSDGFGGDPNDYETAVQATSVTVPDNTVFSKSRISDTFAAGDVDVRIGDTIDYQLDITLQVGTTSAISISDTLDTGLEFVGIVSLNNDTTPDYDSPGIGAGSNFSYNSVTAAALPSVGDTATLTFTLGDVTNDPAGDATTETLSIVYRARVMDSTLAQANGIVLDNNAQLDYNADSQLLSSVSVTVRQPNLTVTSKTENDVDDILAAGETVDYSVLVTNSGDGPAYDTVIVDTLPVGMRDTAPTIVSVMINGAPVANLSAGFLSYDTGTGEFTIDFGEATTYEIPPGGGTLQVVYTATADADLAAGITMINSVIVQSYYSFDDDAQPEPPTVDTREEYGPTVPPAVLPTLTSPTPGAMFKQSPNEINVANSTEVTIGETFTYSISVPETPVNIALHDVIITDNINFADIGADLQLVSFSASGTFNGTVAETSGGNTNLVFEDAVNGIDIPANGQLILDITVEVVDSANNVPGTTFSNITNWSYNTVQDDDTSQQAGTGDTSASMTIIGPDTLILSKSGPANVRVGLPATYSLNVLNDNSGGNSSTAWDITISDQLPNLAPGGMCDTSPDNFDAGIYDNAGTVELESLTLNTDYDINFDGTSCVLTITMQTVKASLPAGQRLIITYDGHLDADTPPVTNITNIAGATEWFSNDTDGAGATGETRTYTETLSTDPAIAAAVDDFEDAVTAVSEAPEISFQKTVVLQVDNGTPGAFDPGDTVRYTVTISNQNDVVVNSFNFTDDLGALNTGTVFNSLNIVSITTGDPGVGTPVDNSNPAGGTNANGLVDISDLSLGTQTFGDNVATIVFDVTLEPVIDSGTVISNQGAITSAGVNQLSNDPVANPGEVAVVLGDEIPTDFTITSAPLFQIEKTSADITGDPAVLVAGDTLRYTITVKNIGLENAINTLLTDAVPVNTTYVPLSTFLNGVRVTTGPADLVSALESGMPINAPEDATAGNMRADTDPAANNVATITFEVEVNASAVVGTVISNQGFVSGDGAGSGIFPQQPSDDPTTATVDDPTIDIVGNVALFDVQKTVAIVVDAGDPGIVNPGDVLRYTITATNLGAVPITNVVLTDAVPADTTYVPDSVLLNNLPVGQPDGGTSPLVAGIDISSSDLTPPLPSASAGTLSPGQSAVVTFDVVVDAAVADSTPISNQGFVSSNELPDEPTDEDGIDSNGDQPTVVTVGFAPTLSITKEVFVIGGGIAQAGGELEYVVRVTNTGAVAVSDVVITDDLVVGQMTYVADSGLLNGLPVSLTGPALTADYSAIYGDLASAGVVELRFRVSLANTLNIDDTVTNRADVSWSVPPSTVSAFAEVSINIGGIPPGTASLNGQVWHDTNFNEAIDGGETLLLLQNWRVELYSNNVLLANVLTNANGEFQFTGLAPSVPTQTYELRYIAPGAVASTATLGNASSAFTNEPQRITDIDAPSGANVLNLNLPIQPNGVVYDSLVRDPVAGVRLTMINQTQSNQQVPASCFDDRVHADQVTTSNGFYKFDLNFSQSLCQPNDDYEIQIQPPANNFIGTTSVIIPPVAAVQNVINCPTDQIGTTAECENSVSAAQPLDSVPAAAVSYYLQFEFNAGPSNDQIYNNHIPVDPDLGGATAISKVAGLQNVTRSQLVPYTITVTNTFSVQLDLNVIDNFPAGFKYVTGSSRVDDAEVEPLVNAQQLTWDIQPLAVGESSTIKLLLVVGSGVGEGEYINTAHMIHTVSEEAASGVASATVRVIPDPSFDCTDIIGKVFDDKNMNAYQDEGETGLPGVQVATARGLRVTTDQHGRFHITCAAVPNEVRGSNFIMKLDDRTLPSGYRITTENPRVQRATRGKMMKFNFGAAIHRVVRLDLADGVFEKGSTELRPQWRSRIDMLIIELQKDASILRLSYLGENETESEVEDRLDAIEELISDRWQHIDCCYKLTIEKEVFWRKGNPSDRKGFE